MDRLATIAAERLDEREPSGVEAEPLSERARAYYLANKEGIDSWNAYVAKRGLPLRDNFDF